MASHDLPVKTVFLDALDSKRIDILSLAEEDRKCGSCLDDLMTIPIRVHKNHIFCKDCVE